MRPCRRPCNTARLLFEFKSTGFSAPVRLLNRNVRPQILASRAGMPRLRMKQVPGGFPAALLSPSVD